MFDNTMLNNGMVLGWSHFGVRIADVIESDESVIIYISVPESSVHIDANNEQMSGIWLAKRFKEVLKDFGIKRLTVKAKIRIGEHWTQSLMETEEEAYESSRNWRK